MSLDMYAENIMDHYNHPHNKGRLENPDILVKDSNPLCGDEIEFSANVSDGKVSDIKFDGKGCAICLASASMLTDVGKGKKINELIEFDKDDLLKLLEIDLSPNRLKCALLSLNVLKLGLKMFANQKGKVRFIRENENTI